MLYSVFRTVFVVAPHGILAGVSAAAALGAEPLEGLWLSMRRHDSFAVAHGTALSSFLIFLPYPSAPRLLRLGELGRGLVERFALASHGCSVHDNVS